jgi:hypothetical protein
MKIFLNFTFCVLWFVYSPSTQAQLLSEPQEISVASTGDHDPGVRWVAEVDFQSSMSSLAYRVGLSIQLRDGSGVFLASSPGFPSFAHGGLIGRDSLVFTNFGGGVSWGMTIQLYNWEVRFPGNQIFVYPMGDYFPGKTNILIGFARQHPVVAGTQYGWVRLERETADTRNAFREDGSQKQVTFMPTAFAVNPIPDQPIRAGEPPDLPQLVTEVLLPEEGMPTRVRVSWAAGWSSMRLESAVELGNPVQWSPVFEVTGTEAVFELPEDGQLYLRLAYVP